MKLPKLKKEDLTKQLREVVGDVDLEFDALVDPNDIWYSLSMMRRNL